LLQPWVFLDQQTNSQQMTLLQPRFAVEVPRGTGGPDGPYINDGTLHTYIGFTSKVGSIEQDEDGISYYIVQKGDTVSEIAELFAVSSNTIIWENNLGKSIKEGQELRILPVSGVRHEVKKGDTISKIAQAYDVETEDITVYNGIDESKLVVGEKIIVPNGVKKKVSAPQTSPSRSPSTVTLSVGTSSSVSSGYYIRPTTGRVTSGFGPRSRGYHYGIDYGAPTGTPIVASASGTVLKTSCGTGYGKCLVIGHDNGTQTLYAHASVLYVSTGTKVKQGQKIAAVGSTGRSTGPHLHFEIIKSNGQKLNPANYVR
jgi:murein DD-endopeptidase MepM/ murein hydrolase activator NlpD